MIFFLLTVEISDVISHWNVVLQDAVSNSKQKHYVKDVEHEHGIKVGGGYVGLLEDPG